MNVTTSTLLNILSPKLNTELKGKIENLSKDGKVDVSTLLKDKSIKMVLSELFKDLTTGLKTKSQVSTLLQNSKAMFDFKSLSTDVKDLLKQIETNPKLEKQATALKEFLVDIKNLDQKALKSNISNSGIFLESKMLTNTTQNQSALVEKLTSNLKDILKQVETNPKLQQQTSGLKEVLSNIKNVDVKALLNSNIPKTVQTVLTQFKDIAQLPQKQEISLNSLIKDVKALITPQTIKSEQFIAVKDLTTNLNNILKQIETNPKLQQQSTILKELIVNIKSIDIKSSQNQDVVKTAQNLLTQLKDATQLPQKQASLLNNLVQDIKTTLIALQSNKLPQTNEFKGDMKAIIMQIQEHIETNKLDTSSGAKVDNAKVEKMLAQIEFYQLLSHSTMSNHTYLPFDWSELEDGDISFKSNEKESFSCMIDLKLKDSGQLKMMLLMDKNNNININISVEQEEFKSKIQDSLQVLRQGISRIGLSLQGLNVFDIQDNNKKSYEQKAYENNNILNLGVDIKA